MSRIPPLFLLIKLALFRCLLRRLFVSDPNEKKIIWKNKMNSYYKSTPKKKLIKDLVKADFKVKRYNGK